MALQKKAQVLEELQKALASVDVHAVDELEQQIASANEIFCGGTGRSGLSIGGFAMRLMHLGLKCNLVGDVLAHPIGKNDLLIITSASGSSKSLLTAAEKAKEVGAKLALITGNMDSALSALADVTVCIRVPSKLDRGTQRASVMPMGTLFEESAYLLFDLIVLDLMALLNIKNDDMLSRHANLE